MNDTPTPPDNEPADGHIHLRVSLSRKGRYVRAARNRKMKLSAWITDVCDKEVDGDSAGESKREA